MKTFSGRKASQNEFELKSFINLLKEKNVKTYLEIGARDGDTFHEVMINLGDDTYGIALDLPGGLWGKVTTQGNLDKACEDLQKRGIRASYLLGDSQRKVIINTIKDCGPFDAILIDGDHTYSGVKSDWENYSSLAPIIAFHDIVGFGEKEKVYNNEVEVPKFWQEIKNENSIEFVAEGSKMGIGVWLKP